MNKQLKSHQLTKPQQEVLMNIRKLGPCNSSSYSTRTLNSLLGRGLLKVTHRFVSGDNELDLTIEGRKAARRIEQGSSY